MPYKSEAQRRFFNSPVGKAKIGAEEVEHWNEVSKGKELPDKVEDTKSGFTSTMHKYNNEVAKGNLEKAKELLEIATNEFKDYEDKSAKKAAKIELNNKRRTFRMKPIDEAIKSCDARSDLRNSEPYGKVYIKDNGSEFIVYDVNGKFLAKFESFDDAARYAKTVR